MLLLKNCRVSVTRADQHHRYRQKLTGQTCEPVERMLRRSVQQPAFFQRRQPEGVRQHGITLSKLCHDVSPQPHANQPNNQSSRLVYHSALS